MMWKWLKHKTDYSNGTGFSIIIMASNGFSTGKASFFNKRKTVCVLSDLSVSKGNRYKGLGTRVIKIGERIAKQHNCKKVFLWVKKNSWMQYWYERLGYTYYSSYARGFIWMVKKLN